MVAPKVQVPLVDRGASGRDSGTHGTGVTGSGIEEELY